MKKLFASSLLIALLLIPMASMAHPGNTDSRGCHTCRTNCPSWGLSYGEYHCHNAKVSNPVYTAPVTPKINVNSDSYIDVNYYNVCRLKSNSDKYLYRYRGQNYYDSQCSLLVDSATEKFVVNNGLASATSKIHYWAYILLKYKNSVK